MTTDFLPRPGEAPPERGTGALSHRWLGTRRQANVDLPTKTTRHLIGDVAAWPLWQRWMVRAELLEGRAGEPGLLVRLRLGTDRVGIDVPCMLVGRSDDTFVFAGGWKSHLRFIDTFHLAGDHQTTTVTRRLEVCVCGPLVMLRPLVARYVARVTNATFAAFD